MALEVVRARCVFFEACPGRGRGEQRSYLVGSKARARGGFRGVFFVACHGGFSSLSPLIGGSFSVECASDGLVISRHDLHGSQADGRITPVFLFRPCDVILHRVWTDTGAYRVGGSLGLVFCFPPVDGRGVNESEHSMALAWWLWRARGNSTSRADPCPRLLRPRLGLLIGKHIRIVRRGPAVLCPLSLVFQAPAVVW